MEQITAGKKSRYEQQLHKGKESLLGNKYLEKEIIYQLTFEEPNGEEKTYVGLKVTDGQIWSPQKVN